MVTLVVENGGGLSNANAYIAVAFADSWHSDMGHDFWAGLTPDQKAQSVIKATMYMDQRFKKRYRGMRQQMSQSLGWPRIGAFDDDSYTLQGVPYQVQRACAEYALRAAWYNTLAPDPIRHTPGQDFSNDPPTTTDDVIVGPLRSKMSKVGPIEETKTYDGANIRDKETTRAVQTGMVDDFIIPEYPEADLWLEQVIRTSATGTRMVRGC